MAAKKKSKVKNSDAIKIFVLWARTDEDGAEVMLVNEASAIDLAADWSRERGGPVSFGEVVSPRTVEFKPVVSKWEDK